MELVRALPKAELHLHIEGTLEPDLALHFAQRNGMPEALPYKTVQEAREAYKFNSLQSFLDLYYSGCAVLQTQQDFFDLTWAYLKEAHANQVAHVELFWDPQTHTERGVTFESSLLGIHAALQRAASDLHITGNIIMCFLRHLGADAAWTCLHQSLPFKNKIVGVGLDSTEIGYPCNLFEAVFTKAKQAGFRVVAHAGEEGTAENVWQALRVLHVERVDHGIHALDDAELMQHLVARRMPLTVCPLSNLKLKVYDGELESRLRELLDNEQLCVTINSDDPAYFGGYMLDNWEYLLRVSALSEDRIYQLHINSFRASFLAPEQLDRHLHALKAAFHNFKESHK